MLDQQHTGTSQTPADSTWPSRLTAQPHVLTCSARLSQEGARAKRAPRVAPPLPAAMATSVGTGLASEPPWGREHHGGESEPGGPWQGEGTQAGSGDALDTHCLYQASQESGTTEHLLVPRPCPSHSSRDSPRPGTPSSSSPSTFLSHSLSHCKASRQNARRKGHACRMPLWHYSPLRLLPPPRSWDTSAQAPGSALLRTPLWQELTRHHYAAALLVQGEGKAPSHGPKEPQPSSRVLPKHSALEKDEEFNPMQCLGTRGDHYQQRARG